MRPISVAFLMAGQAIAALSDLRYYVTNFSASKGYNTGYCTYAFDVVGLTILVPAHCTAYVDAGFSGATWLALVWNGTCDDDTVKWTFNDPVNGGDALLTVFIDGITGNYTVLEKDIMVWLNDEPNSFDNDIAYIGPREFDISEF